MKVVELVVQHLALLELPCGMVAGEMRERRTFHRGHRVLPPSYALDDTPTAHLKFALRHEPTDLGVLVAALKRIPAKEPTGTYFRKAWFLHETFTGMELDLPDAEIGNYVPVLGPDKQLVAGRRDGRRPRVLHGGRALCGA